MSFANHSQSVLRPEFVKQPLSKAVLRLFWPLAMLGWFLPIYAPLQAAEVTLAGRSIMVDGELFVMKGVCYQPTPIGQSAAQPPFGDYFTSNYRSLYERDLPLMRAMGANTIRVYNWDSAADHALFLDQAWNRGIQPLHVLINAYIEPQTDWSSRTVLAQLKSRWRTLVRNTSSHPAVIGYLLGNELNVINASKPSFWASLNEIALEVRALATNRLVTTPLADQNLVSIIRTNNSKMTGLNCWAIQSYRGRTFGTLFGDYAAISAKPLLVTEFGIDAYDLRSGAEYSQDASLPAEYLKSLWLEIARRTNIVSGGAVFEWVDEWWKDQTVGTSTLRHDSGAWAAAAFPDGSAEHEWWGIFQAAAVGSLRLQPRAAFAMFQELWQAPRPRFTGTQSLADGTFHTILEGPAGAQFRIEASRDATAWISIATNIVPFPFKQTNGSELPRRLFRAVQVE